MRVYLAARYSRREELLVYKRELEQVGVEVVARWLLGTGQVHAGVQRVESAVDDMPVEGELFARDDLEDLLAADVVVSFTERPRGLNSSRGGRHVEFGVALASGKGLVIVGPRENVFHCLPQVERYWTWGDALAELKRHAYGLS